MPPASPDDLPPLRDVIAAYGLGARKSLGQHFLLDLNLTARIARSAGDLLQGITVEIGPGPGGLTRALLGEGAASVLAIEKDLRCLEALAGLVAAYPDRLTVVDGDAMALDPAVLAAAHGPGPVRIVANLPYNVATPLLIGWLRTAGQYESLTLMFQREVADRIVAEPGSRTYGRLSVISQLTCETSRVFNIPAAAFVPPPKVASTVVQFRPRSEMPTHELILAVETVTAAAFGNRRKMLRQSLKSLQLDPAALTNAAGVDPTARAETLTVEDFRRLAECYLRHLGEDPV